MTPRQRIVAQREIARLRVQAPSSDRLSRLQRDYEYSGIDTCAADGLCATACPVGINTGDLTRKLRAERHQHQTGRAQWVGDHFAGVTQGVRAGLAVAGGMQALLGDSLMQALNRSARRLSGERLPQWLPEMPRPAARHRPAPTGQEGDGLVYLPSCATRTLGPSRGDPEQRDLRQVTETLLARAGYRVIYPEGLAGLCCGLSFHSKGLFDAATDKLGELQQALYQASEGGRWPIYCDTSPCLQRMREGMAEVGLTLLDPVDLSRAYLLPRLQLKPLPETVAVHATCSVRKMGGAEALYAIARQCAERVVIPDQVGCCGFAGDRGFQVPELNRAALKDLRPALPPECAAGYSTSRTCEIGLSHHGGIPYRSILYLLERASRADV